MSYLIGFLAGVGTTAFAFQILLWWCERFYSKKRKTSLTCVSISINNFKTTGIIMATSIPVKKLAATAFRVRDDDKSTPDNPVYIDGVTYANETAVVEDENIATVSVDPQDGPDTAILDVNGVAPGTTKITFTAAVTYTDPGTQLPVTKTLSADLSVTVSANETNTSLVVELGEPQAPATV